MRCSECGSENADNKKFCTSCGKPLATPTAPQAPVESQQPTTQMPAAPVPPVTPAAAPVVPQAPGPAPVYAPLPPVKKSSKRTWIVVVSIVLALVVIGAAIAIPLIVAASNKPVAQITSAKIVRTDGESLNTDKVPLGTELAFKVEYNAKYKQPGSGTIQLTVVDAEGKNVMDKSYDVSSSARPQSKEMKFTMDQGSGKPLSAKAKLAVTQGKEKLSSNKAMAFTMVSGKSAALLLQEATAAATKKCQEATDLLKNASAQGVSITDLANRLSQALTDLAAAKTAEQANAATGKAQTVIDECNARISAQAQESKARDICRQNQAVVRAKLVDWWGGSGNFPNSMSDLYNVPVCPDGGTYTYNAPDTTPATLHVSCSIHGEL